MTTRPSRHVCHFTIAQIRALRAAGVLRPAPINRDVIPDAGRPKGSSKGYWNDMYRGMNGGQMVGYSLEDTAVVAAAFATSNFGDVVLLVTDFGHRLSWICSDPEDIVFENGHTFRTLESAEPDKFVEMISTPIAISMSTHTDKAFLESFAWEEYRVSNTTQTHHSPGELAAARPRNQTREAAETLAKHLIETYYPETAKKPRAESELLVVATVNGLGKTMEAFNRRDTGDGNVLEVAKESLTPAEAINVVSALSSLEDVERALVESSAHSTLPDVELAEQALVRASAARKAAPRGDKTALVTAEALAKKELKAAKKRDKDAEDSQKRRMKLLLEREYDPAYIGPVLYGLSTELDVAKDVYRRWMDRALADKDTWKKMRKDVFDCKGEGNTARYYNEKRYKAGWTRMKSMLDV